MKRWMKVALIVVGALALVLLVGPFLVPVPPLEDTVPPQQLADADSRFVTVNGLEVHYKRYGEGEPAMVLLHGFGASTFSWREVVTPLAELGTVVAFDRPAFGLTERPLPGEWEEGENPYRPEAQVALTVGLMDALEIERAVLVGNSAGGTVAVHTALTHPDRVVALVLVDAAIYTGGSAPRAMRWLLSTPQMDHLGPLIARRIRTWGREFGRSAWHDPSAIPSEFWEGYETPLRAEHWDRALWELTKASRASQLGARLDEVRVPALVVTGDDDRIVPTEQSVRLAAELPDADLVVIPQCGHIPQEECPAPWMDAVRDFIAAR
jgi:pimeloyl-ACP methyl ester carboxylesterase